MEPLTPQQIITIATEAAAVTAIQYLSDSDTQLSHKQATKKYGGLVELWVRSNLIKPTPTTNCKFKTYSASRLAFLYRQYVNGNL